MEAFWTKSTRGLSGSRWAVYQSQVKNRIEMTWAQFKDDVARHNPELSEDGWIFRPNKIYRLPELPQQPATSPRRAKIITGVPYFSQMDNPHTDGRYWASDPDRKDETPDGCWMNELPGGGSYGRQAAGCPGPMEKGCVRPGSCNVTSLYMLLKFHKLNRKPNSYPDGKRLSSWLLQQPLSPTWIYVYMMDFWGKGRQLWDGVHPSSAYNSVICARGDYQEEVIRRFAKAAERTLEIRYTTSVTFTEFKRAIDRGSPVIIHSRKMRHVLLGIGYEVKRSVPHLIVHDPYGKKRRNLKKWEFYNGCGDRAEHGREVLYPLDRLVASYLLTAFAR
jgi:uncharacterized protein YvpB